MTAVEPFFGTRIGETARRDLLARHGRIFARGETVFSEGEAGREMFVVHHGRVRISKRAGDVDKVLAELGEGEFIGEMAILTGQNRSATVRVVEDATLLVIDAPVLERMILENAEIAFRMLRKLAERLERADDQIRALVAHDHYARMAVGLLALAAEKAPGQERVQIPYDAEQLAARLDLEAWEIDEVSEHFARVGLIVVSTPLEGGDVTTLEFQPARLREFRRFLEIKQKFGDIW